jgi:transposase
MQGRHFYQPELFSAVNVERLIPAGHLLRRVDRVLKLDFLYELTAPLYSESRGRPSVDPEVFVRMVLLQALYNIDSDRQLCEEIGFNLAYRWFCRLSLSDDVPDHSSITKIRDRLGEEIYQKIFDHVISQCKEAGLVKGERILADGSHIQANASIYAMKKREKSSDDDKSDPPLPKGTGVGARESKDGFSNNDLKRDSIAGKKLSNETHYSPIDPDATLAGKHMEYKSLRYKTHHIADADSRVILDCHVTTGSESEINVFIERLEKTKSHLEIPVKEVIADRGYGSGENLTHLKKDLKVKTNIPLWSTYVGRGFLKEVGFEYDQEKLEVKCPVGNVMKRLKGTKLTHVFQLPATVCRNCPHYKTCLSESEQRQPRGKKIRISVYHEIYKEVLDQEKDPEFKKKLRERMWKMEGLFAEAKVHHGLRRARYRGRWKMQAQVYVIATVQNLKRLASRAGSSVKSFLSNFGKFSFWNPEIEIFLNFAS